MPPGDEASIHFRPDRYFQRSAAVTLALPLPISGLVEGPIIVTTRTRSSTTRFAAPFTLAGIDQTLPAGEYRIDHDEEAIDGLSWIAYRSVATYIHLPSIERASRPTQIVEIASGDLEAAIAKDSET